MLNNLWMNPTITGVQDCKLKDPRNWLQKESCLRFIVGKAKFNSWTMDLHLDYKQT